MGPATHRQKRLAASGVAAVLTLSVIGWMAQPAAAASTVRALWRMGETSGTTMHDSSGQGHNGTLTNVKVGQPGFSGLGYGFNGTSSIVKVPSASSLNPGSSPFTWTTHVKFTKLPSADYDLVRKGLSTTSGGHWKSEILNTGKAFCEVRGSAGTAHLSNGPMLNNGAWHTVTCTRNGSTLTLTVDGKSYSTTHASGTVSNSAQLTMGAKTSNGDYFNGVMDEVRLAIG